MWDRWGHTKLILCMTDSQQEKLGEQAIFFFYFWFSPKMERARKRFFLTPCLHLTRDFQAGENFFFNQVKSKRPRHCCVGIMLDAMSALSSVQVAGLIRFRISRFFSYGIGLLRSLKGKSIWVRFFIPRSRNRGGGYCQHHVWPCICAFMFRFRTISL